MNRTFSVSEVLRDLEVALTRAFPRPVWVKGEISGFKRTNRGAVFFDLIDPEAATMSINVAARGLVIADVERSLQAANVGNLRNGIEIRLKATVGQHSGRVRLSLLEVDPEFIAGRLALDRDEIVRRLKTDGLLEANSSIPIPIVPLRIGLITSVGSAAHADFLDQLRRPGYRFRVGTVEARVQGEGSVRSIVRGLGRLAKENLDVIVVARGGGSKLDLATFDAEAVARAIAAMPMPVLTGIGHETDQSVADSVASVALKTPTAAAEWIVARVADFAGRVDRARLAIRDEAMRAVTRADSRLDLSARELGTVRTTLKGQLDWLDRTATDIGEKARVVISGQGALLDSLGQLVATVGLEPTLKRGFAVVTRPDGTAVKEAATLSKGELVRVRMVDGVVGMSVEEEL